MNAFKVNLIEKLRNEANGDSDLLYMYGLILYTLCENKEFVNCSTNERYGITLRELGGYCYDVIDVTDEKDDNGYLGFYCSRPDYNGYNMIHVNTVQTAISVSHTSLSIHHPLVSQNVLNLTPKPPKATTQIVTSDRCRKTICLLLCA